MALADVYQLTLSGRFLGVTTQNVFFYVQTQEVGSTNWAVALDQSWRESFLDLAGVGPFENVAFSDNWEVMSTAVKNLFSPLEIGGTLIGGMFLGTSTVANAGTFQAYRFRTNRPRGDIRRGMKYFGGIPGGVSIDGILVTTVQSALATLETTLGQTLLYDQGGNEAEFVPVVVQRVRMEPDEDHPNVWYRLPENLDEYEGFEADTWELDTVLTTMNSRKFGRGI